MHREVDAAVSRLRSIIRTAEVLATIVEDLHVCAYDRPVSDEVKVSGGDTNDINPLTGDPEARRIFGKMTARLEDTDNLLTGYRVAALNLLNVGQQRPEDFGSRISHADFVKALKAQRRRDDRGEYAPALNLAQPRYPGRRS